MIKLIGTAYKRDDFSTRDFFDYWRDVHAPISAASGPMRGYVVSEVVRKLHNPNNPESAGGLEVDAFVEQWWDDEETFQRAMDSDNEAAAWEDVLNYARPDGTFWVTKEHVYIPAPITSAGSLTRQVWLA